LEAGPVCKLPCPPFVEPEKDHKNGEQVSSCLDQPEKFGQKDAISNTPNPLHQNAFLFGAYLLDVSCAVAASPSVGVTAEL
jgi:hypothetical protein